MGCLALKTFRHPACLKTRLDGAGNSGKLQLCECALRGATQIKSCSESGHGVEILKWTPSPVRADCKHDAPGSWHTLLHPTRHLALPHNR